MKIISPSSTPLWLVLSLAISNANYAAGPPFTIKNNSSFYLMNNDASNHPNCPLKIAPGQTATIPDHWCGFLSCATSNYDEKQGCMEWVSIDHSQGLTQGGYATWFSISPGTNLCNIASTNAYLCSYNNAGGNFNLGYATIVQKYSAGPMNGQTVVLPPVRTFSSGPLLRGINISGMEYDGTFLDALYQRADIPDMLYFVQQGMNTIRFPIRWEFLLADSETNLVENHNPTNPTINMMYMQSIIDSTKNYLDSGLYVIIDLHNYMRFCDSGTDIGQGNEPTFPVETPQKPSTCRVVTSAQLSYIWGILADKLAPLARQYPQHLIFGLMNEPFSIKGESKQEITTPDLFDAEIAAVIAIRNKGLLNPIILSGNYWDPLHGWTNFTPYPGDANYPPNGQVFTADKLAEKGITNLDNIYLEVHQYFNSNYSGTTPDCVQYSSYDDFKQKLGLTDFPAWMKKNHMKVILSEFGASTNAACKQDLNYMLRFVTENTYNSTKSEDGGFIGWTAWRANRHTGSTGFAPFNYLQDSNFDVYGAQGYESNPPNGTGIVKGMGNELMNSIFANYLTSSPNPDTTSKVEK